MNLLLLMTKMMTKKIITAISTIALLLFLWMPPVAAKQITPWQYEGIFGPDHWGQFATVCETGKKQSPLNITGTFNGIDRPITIHYQPSKLQVVQVRHTIQVNYEPGSFITIGDDTYNLLQFHFHKPSEEEINGQAKAMVVHFVHKNALGKLAVLGSLVEAGEASPTIQAIWEHLPQEEGEEITLPNLTIDAFDLLPTDLSYYHYMGSLTTPPCTEEVAFYIFKKTIVFSTAQIAAFPFPHNARPVQPLNDRQIFVYDSPAQ